MAKRRKVAAPSAEDLNRIEEEFRRETLTKPGAMAPISQVASETAHAQPIEPAETRAEQARDKRDAEELRVARGQGRVIVDLPIGQIKDDAMVRDRMVMDSAEMEELKLSIAAHGLRLPVEVFDRREAVNADDTDSKPYGVLSGYRRLTAFRDLYALTRDEKYSTIKALIRDPDALGGAFAAMVEENEIRAGLSHFERGRIAVIAAQQGVFTGTEQAVAALFSAASKAKRSKIRSFSLIFEELGDMLAFPEGLKERDGLRLATALRHGGESQLREALGQIEVDSSAEEWAILEPVVARMEAVDKPTNRGGRPKRTAANPGWQGAEALHLSTGITLRRLSDRDGHLIRIEGKAVDAEMIELAMQRLADLLEG